MTAITYAASDSYPIAILLKQSSFTKAAVYSNYVMPLEEAGINKDTVIAFSLPYNEADKAPVKHISTVLDALLPELLDENVKYIYCADAAFFKKLAGVSKAEPNLGYCLPCTYAGYEDLQVILGINHTSIIYNPLNESKLQHSLTPVINSMLDEPAQYEKSIITNACYPVHIDDVTVELTKLLAYPALSCDIETFSLDHDKAGIATIAFAWNDSEGVAFHVDYAAHAEKKNEFGKYRPSPARRKALRDFFENYTGQLTFHNANFDVKVLIYGLFMQNLWDTEGLLNGLEILTRDFDDTKIISYLALNSCATNKYSLKALAQEYAGNYAQDDEDIKDIRRIPLPQLLEYNLIDACCTNWLHDKYYEPMVHDGQADIYFNIMLPSLKTIIQMELTGMPLNPQRVQHVKAQLEKIRDTHDKAFRAHPAVKHTEEVLTAMAHVADYESRRDKAKNPDKIKEKDKATFPRVVLNANSPKQLQALLYITLKLPVIEKTKTGQPATGADVLEKLKNHAKNTSIEQLFDDLIGFTSAEKILSTFISAFEKAIKHHPDDPRVYLHGSFNLGGTRSGRLSSSDPNLTNIPSNSIHGKLVKTCFQPSNQELFVGADFNSLEAMVNAIMTRDPNKLAVYENDLDSHSWNAFGYWPDKMPDVAKRMSFVDTPGKFYKRELADGTFEYLHESEL